MNIQHIYEGETGLSILNKINAAFDELNNLANDFLSKNGTGMGDMSGDYIINDSLPTRMVTDDGYYRNGMFWYGAASATLFSQRKIDNSYTGFVTGNMSAKIDARDFTTGLATGMEFLTDQINLFTSNPAFKGFQGDADYSPYSDALSFIQRAYVDNNFVPLLNADSILFNNTNGIDANNTLSIGETYAAAINFGNALTHHYFNGALHVDKMRAMYGVDLTVVGTFLDFPSGGGIKNAQLYGCTFLSDLAFANSTGITSAGKLAIGDADGLYSGAGGTYNYFRMAGLSGNYGVPLNRFVQPTNGGFAFVSAPGYFNPNRYSFVTPDDKFQLFGDGGWEMPVGASLKDQFDADIVINPSPTYDAADLSNISNLLQDTRQRLAAVIRHLGSQVYPADFTTGSNKVTTTAMALPGRHRVRFIQGPVPASINLFQWYFVEDAGQTGTDLQVSASYGGSAISFASSTTGAVMEVENSGMNLLKD